VAVAGRRWHRSALSDALAGDCCGGEGTVVVPSTATAASTGGERVFGTAARGSEAGCGCTRARAHDNRVSARSTRAARGDLCGTPEERGPAVARGEDRDRQGADGSGGEGTAAAAVVMDAG
jgi:hypothetical protein